MSEKSHSDLEQPLNLLNAALVREKQDDMVIGLDHGIMVRDNHLIAPDNRADRGTPRQLDILYSPPHDTGAGTITMCNGLDCLCSAAPQ